MKKGVVLLSCVAMLLGCAQKNTGYVISKKCCDGIVAAVQEACPSVDKDLLEKGVNQAAALWRQEDGSEQEFKELVLSSYETTPEGKRRLFDKLSTAFEQFNCYSDLLQVDLSKPTILSGYNPTAIDEILGSYNATAHFSDDMFANKVAFICMLNFPNYSLAEKNASGSGWSRLDWAYARMGDVFTERVPSKVQQEVYKAYTEADAYIADYNIFMGNLLTEEGERLFPEDMVLLSHWNLRDELKSNYADVPNAHEKQEMIYKVMQRIVCQDIPRDVVNNRAYDWAPYSNKTWHAANTDSPDSGLPVELKPEVDLRYQHILDQFHTYLEMDKYCPAMPTGIQRNFDGGLEVSRDDIGRLFVDLISSEQVKKVGELISQRLGRPLRPYDIWYDGFKPRSTMPEDKLTAQTRKLYPDAEAFHRDMPRQLMNLGFKSDDAQFIADHIVVEPSRGSGHAWETHGRWEPARLRTRIGREGMDYKGYNIAVHEFGHDVEMVLDMYRIDHYMLYGVPNTAFTEAMAFLFQYRDLQLLGYGKQQMDDDITLDIFWGMYEIMGVSLVDMFTWEWLYGNPSATAVELRDNVLRIAREVWNQYYEPVLGEHDSPILAVYSHMVNSPMYLPAYPYGHLVQFQLEEHLASCPDEASFANEIYRIYTQGRLTPNAWMQGAVGACVSTQPVLDAVSKILLK